MAAIERTATGSWQGNLKDGNGTMTTPSGTLREAPFTYLTRFENASGTNPEELIAAAHAGCFSMAFANHLSGAGHEPDEIRTRATVTFEDGKLSRMHLVVEGRVPSLDADGFAREAEAAEKKCPVSNLLRGGLEISLETTLK